MDSLITMSETLAHLGGENFKDVTNSAKIDFGNDLLRYYGCTCAETLASLGEDPSALQIRQCVQTLQEMLVKADQSMLDGGARPWLCKHVLSLLFGRVIGKLQALVTEAVNSQPDVEALVVGRNQQRLRKLVFEKSTHEACVGSLEDFQGACAALDSLPIDNWLTQSQCGQVKALSTKLQKVKVYASSVHGLNLLFHRFANRNRVERSALCREHLGIKGTQPAILWQLCFRRTRASRVNVSRWGLQVALWFFCMVHVNAFVFFCFLRYRKTLERNGVTVSKALMQWLQEEAATA